MGTSLHGWVEVDAVQRPGDDEPALPKDVPDRHPRHRSAYVSTYADIASVDWDARWDRDHDPHELAASEGEFRRMYELAVRDDEWAVDATEPWTERLERDDFLALFDDGPTEDDGRWVEPIPTRRRQHVPDRWFQLVAVMETLAEQWADPGRVRLVYWLG